MSVPSYNHTHNWPHLLDTPTTQQWTFVGISATSALFYLAILLATLVGVMQRLRRKQQELSSLTPSAQAKFTGLFSSLRFFLVVTSIVAVCSVLTVVLPTEVMLHHWQHNKTEYTVDSIIQHSVRARHY